MTTICIMEIASGATNEIMMTTVAEMSITLTATIHHMSTENHHKSTMELNIMIDMKMKGALTDIKLVVSVKEKKKNKTYTN